MTIAIVGAGGRLGEATLRAVLDRGTDPETVVAAVRRPEKLSSWADQGVQVRRADYDDPTSLVSVFAGVERVLLVPTFAVPVERVRQYENAIAAAREAGVGHLVHYGLVPTTVEAEFIVTPFLLYAESALRTSGVAWTILRNSLYADPIVEWVPSILELGTIPYPTGTGACAYVGRADIGRAGAAVLTTSGHEGKTYHLTGPRLLTTADLCESVARVTGAAVEHRPASDKDYLEVCRSGGESEWITQALLTLYHTIRDGHLAVRTDDVEALTGGPPADFEDLLRC